MIINNDVFIIKEVPDFHPISQKLDRIAFWSDHKRRCIEGMWSSGKWCPGQLFFFINAWYIRLRSQKGSIGKVVGRPLFRDIEWEKAYNLTEALGFSGFSEDKEFTCLRILGPEKQEAEELGLIEAYLNSGRISKQDLSKTYVSARDYLRKWHETEKGKPLYLNPAMNIFDMETREAGKSYWAAGAEIAHTFLFDGAADYDEYLKAKRSKKYMSSQTVIGAIETSYSADTLEKFKLGLRHLPGEVKYNGESYPSPLTVSFTGTLSSGKYIESSNSKSMVKHVAFSDNPLAAAGTRPRIVILEEVGFMHNIEEVIAGLDHCIVQDSVQSGVIHGFGTGGLVQGRAALHMEKIFYNPEAYNALAFEDVWQGRGKICYFLPATYAVNDFKEGPDYITDKNKAEKFFLKRREKKKKSNQVQYVAEIINRPLNPSELFLSIESKFFPSAELRDIIAKVEGNPEKYINANWIGSLIFNEREELEWRGDDSLQPIREFPLLNPVSTEGAIEIFEMPKRDQDRSIPRGRYIAGIDPIDKDISSTDSLGSIIVMDRWSGNIVCEYTGRSEHGSKPFYEKCRRILIFYNALAMYEKTLTGLFTYFESHRSLHLLAETPVQFRDAQTYKEGTNTAYGINASERTNRIGREFIKAWLWEESPSSPGLRNMDRIRAVGLLKELISWNPDANFDRISAFGMLMWLDQTMYKAVEQASEKVKSISEHPYWKRYGLIKAIENQLFITADMPVR